MDVPIQRGDGSSAGTGPFAVAGGGATKAATEMIAFDGYYQERPATSISRIAFSAYPNVRAAWADMLRDQLDMLYEVSADALDTMRGATNVAVYAFDRPFQYLVFLNPSHPKLKSPAVRRALNEAIDRKAVIEQGLAGHGTPSVGPVSQHHWAFQPSGSTFTYAPQAAASKIGKPFRLTCLTLAEPPFEQLALVVKQQLRAIGVDLQIEQVAGEQIAPTLAKHEFEAVLLEASAGWSLLRAYRWWHSQGAQNNIGFSSAKVDTALDRIRRAVDDEQYRAGVAAFQDAVAADPPAIFLAWSERSRAVTKRFDVQPQPGRDILGTLRMWRPSADTRNATNN